MRASLALALLLGALLLAELAPRRSLALQRLLGDTGARGFCELAAALGLIVVAAAAAAATLLPPRFWPLCWLAALASVFAAVTGFARAIRPDEPSRLGSTPAFRRAEPARLANLAGEIRPAALASVALATALVSAAAFAAADAPASRLLAGLCAAAVLIAMRAPFAALAQRIDEAGRHGLLAETLGRIAAAFALWLAGAGLIRALA